MSALVWMELRENIVWAVLLMLVLGGAEIYALHHTEYGGSIDIYFNNGVTLCKTTFLMVTTFGSALAGLALGLLQVLPELKRDRWAALLHRPLPRGQIFWGKALAGLVLYFIAVGVPFLFSVWHVATPGNLNAPFVPAMIRPGLADVIGGLAFYFAGLAVALQGGGILRCALPFLAAFHSSFAAQHENLFRVAVEGSAAMALALCVAGWGAIYARDTLHGRPWLGCVASLIVAFYGACSFGDLVWMAGELTGRKGTSKYSYWEVLDNGSPVRSDYLNGILVSATDPDGKPFTEPKYHLDRVRSYTLGMNRATSYVGDPHGWHYRWQREAYRESQNYIYALQSYSHPRLEQWFHIYGGTHYAGVLPVERRVFAQLGAKGFAPAEAAVPAFSDQTTIEQSGSAILFIADRETLRYVRLSKREITPLALPAPGPIYGMSHIWARVPSGSVDFKGVALGTMMAIYDDKGQVAATVPYHYDVDRWGQLSVGVLPSMDRFVLLYEPSIWIDGKTRKTMPIYCDLVDAKGNVLQSYAYQATPREVYSTTWGSFLADRLNSPAFFFGEMLYQRVGSACGSLRLRQAWQDHWGENTKSTDERARVIALVALVLAVVTFFWARRAQVPLRLTLAWTVAVLLLGLGGFVMFWLTGARPRTVACPACRRPRRIDHEQCSQCGAAWPAHAADDTEIIDHPLVRVPVPFA
ncbi:MAG: hypothetical protein P4L99_06280 [Chthoniobacter sp.]|nr:hypothetical protein [Chthoniobacter sp.]